MPTWPISSIKELLEPTLNHMGYELYSLDQSGQSGRTLRISIDHAEPITIEDCERVSKVAGPLLDHANLISGPSHQTVGPLFPDRSNSGGPCSPRNQPRACQPIALGSSAGSSAAHGCPAGSAAWSSARAMPAVPPRSTSAVWSWPSAART